MCRLCAWIKTTSKNLSHFTFICLFLIYLSSGVTSEISFNLQKRIQHARTNNCSNCKQVLDMSIAQKRQLDIILRRIRNKLEIGTRTKPVKEPGGKPRDSVSPQQKYMFPEMSEIISFPEKPDNATSKNVLQFTINAQNKQEQLEAMKVNLWILVKQRKKGRTRGKKILLRVYQIDDENKTQRYLTSIRTRVKKTRWQKIGLPVTLIQSMLDSDKHLLKIKVSCKKCGKIVKPILRRQRRHRKRRHKRKKKKHKKAINLASLRNRSFKNTESVQPFLVISTRYKHRLNSIL